MPTCFSPLAKACLGLLQSLRLVSQGQGLHLGMKADGYSLNMVPLGLRVTFLLPGNWRESRVGMAKDEHSSVMLRSLSGVCFES